MNIEVLSSSYRFIRAVSVAWLNDSSFLMRVRAKRPCPTSLERGRGTIHLFFYHSDGVDRLHFGHDPREMWESYVAEKPYGIDVLFLNINQNAKALGGLEKEYQLGPDFMLSIELLRASPLLDLNKEA